MPDRYNTLKLWTITKDAVPKAQDLNSQKLIWLSCEIKS